MTSPRKLGLPLLALLLLAGGGALYAQLESGDRGVPPIDSSNALEIDGIEVDTRGETAEEARQKGWREAQRKGFAALWARMNRRPVSEAPELSDSTLDSIVSGIVIGEEQIGPTRYIATLGVLFDRGRAGEMLGFKGIGTRSHPVLVIPVMVSGSTMTSFERRNPWQEAWARFRAGASAIDYVRVSGEGSDPLLLNAAQTRRPGRGWWRMVLDQYGAVDIVVPEVYLKRDYPGGPATGIFIARYGPDGEILDRFRLRARRGAAIPKMMEEGVKRIDQAYIAAFREGIIKADPSLILVRPADVAEEIEQAREREADELRREEREEDRRALAREPIEISGANTYRLQVATPSPAAAQQAAVSVSGIEGVTSSLTLSTAIGGTSVIQITYQGSAAELRAALAARGWTVSGSGQTLNISRPQAAPAPAPPPEPVPEPADEQR
ncbi:MAG: heavy-metal-associated domain-containing protein [Sphingomonadaceae bacterium]